MYVCIALRPAIENIYFIYRECIDNYLSDNIIPPLYGIGCVYLDHRPDLVDVDVRPILSHSF